MVDAESVRFLITGHGRSGTNYMSALFRHLGYEVGAQQGGRNGMSHNFPGKWPFSAARRNFDYMIQVVRDPWRVAESTFLAHYSIPGVYGKYLPELLEMSAVDRVIASVILWNEAIDEARPDLVVRVEEAEEACERWLNDIGLGVRLRGPSPPHNINARKSHGWHIGGTVPWRKISAGLMYDFMEHFRKYGYENRCSDDLR